jgi:hypothetical protein
MYIIIADAWFIKGIFATLKDDLPRLKDFVIITVKERQATSCITSQALRVGPPLYWHLLLAAVQIRGLPLYWAGAQHKQPKALQAGKASAGGCGPIYRGK